MSPDPAQASATLEAFSSIGIDAFDVSLLTLAGKCTACWRARPTHTLHHTLPSHLATTTATRTSIILRPLSTHLTLIQLDDLKIANLEQLKPFSFLILQTSAESYQIWLALDGKLESTRGHRLAPDSLPHRLKLASGADAKASGAFRIPGSFNFKPCYAPDFPLVRIQHLEPGRIVNEGELIAAGLLGTSSAPAKARVNAGACTSSPAPKSWPLYAACLAKFPLNSRGSGPDRSKADFHFAGLALRWGWSAEEVVERLMMVSEKANEIGERYAWSTVEAAVKSLPL